ncbi:dicarboxylate/amino acid:cation symporter [Waddlia chondrophila]|uniref:Putative proton/sodium-glutamate symport protein n=1 Tax=Waddlia chondrophila (strain ATCC VR-1470 / WSU 86-1044) TaxID=716544 RepID=D6YUJ6_WADCW|nr:dicarboxylate/amino acid:cation symporter [Waddlia chondrophila]ADI37807.1 putative proton/sodium-glutamate symport protein [Waddlia chondrophila WSU 86-1044]
MKKKRVLVKVFLAIALGAAAGLAAGKDAGIFGIPWIRIFNLMGQLFLNALTIVVVPLVSSSIITGTARVGADKEFAKLGRRTFFYFILTSLIAVLTGLTLTLLIGPGDSVDFRLLSEISPSPEIVDLQGAAAGGLFDKFENILFRLVPSNILSAAAQGQLLGLIFFSLLFGYFIPRVDKELSETMQRFWDGVFQIMMRMTHLVMEFLPIGVFGLVAKVTATTGLGTVKPVSIFFLTVMAGLGIHMFFMLSFLLKARGGINPLQHFKAVLPAIVTAYSTSSSAATLPVTIECMEERAGLPNSLCSFILPLGSTVNLAGTALYVTSAVIFISQAYHLEMNLATLLPIIVLGLFTSLGMVAGIPSGSIVSIVIILQSIGLPSDGIVLILAVERILDMFRTSVSVYNNTCCASLVHEW